MSERQIAPYGSWRSPISAELVASQGTALEQVRLDGGDTYWIEMRPGEGGRNVIVRRAADGQSTDVTPLPFNARTRVHEYGGGSYLVDDGTVFFSHFDDQRLYGVEPGRLAQPITPEAKLRFADGILDGQRGRVIAVREDHTNQGIQALNAIVALDPTGQDPNQGGQLLVWGNDFYASPRVSPDGAQLAWLTWNHPDMPWDGSELWVARFQPNGTLGEATRIAGGPDESVFQPEWSPDGTLCFVSDRNGWWNLYRLRNGAAEPLWETDAEYGLPQWVFGMSTYAFVSARRIACTYTRDGRSQLASLDTETLQSEPIEVPFTSIWSLRATTERAVFIGSSPTEAPALIQLDLRSGAVEVLRRSSSLALDLGYVASPEALEFPTERGLTAHAFFYAPTNREYAAAPGDRPPLIVISHGGPTGATNSALQLDTQYWTSRGFAVLDVNYGGSTGYGRAYRERLLGQWGVVDVDDCCNGARYLVQQGRVDGERLVIRGGSAGGYTTLAALAFRDVFRAGASYYGVSDLGALARETHKFESRYLDRLIGPYPARRDLYEERSPIHSVNSLSCPVIFFQGMEDRVVPPSQAERMVEALRAKGLPVAYVPFEGEQHGFRRAEHIQRALECELFFYSRVFGFELAEPVEPVLIENLAP